MFGRVGEPVMVGADDSLHGPHYDEPGNKALRDRHGEWSDSMWDVANYPTFLDGVYACLCSCCCPCVVIYKSIERVGRVGTPCGAMDHKRYLGLFVGTCLLYMIIACLRIPPDIMCRDVPVDEADDYRRLYDDGFILNARSLVDLDAASVSSGWNQAKAAASSASDTVADSELPSKAEKAASGAVAQAHSAAANEASSAAADANLAKVKVSAFASTAAPMASAEVSAMMSTAAPVVADALGATPAPAFSQSSAFGPDGGEPVGTQKVERRCRNLWTMIMDVVIRWVIPLIAIKGIRDKLGVTEDDKVTLVKSPCLPECFLCCQFCYLSQVQRHVDRVQGFTPVAEERVGMQADRPGNDGF